VSKKLDVMFVSPEFKKKMFYEAKVVRGITVAEYTRILAQSDDSLKQSIKPLLPKKDKLDKRGFQFGF